MVAETEKNLLIWEKNMNLKKVVNMKKNHKLKNKGSWIWKMFENLQNIHEFERKHEY